METICNWFVSAVNTVNDWVWSPVLVALCLVAALYFSFRTRFVQVRRLDGTVVNNSGKLAPGVYYVKDSRGIWKKMAVMPR